MQDVCNVISNQQLSWLLETIGGRLCFFTWLAPDVMNCWLVKNPKPLRPFGLLGEYTRHQQAVLVPPLSTLPDPIERMTHPRQWKRNDDRDDEHRPQAEILWVIGVWKVGAS